MLARRPVAASAGGASIEVLGSDYPFIVAAGDPSALARAILEIGALDAEHAQSLVDANFDRATTLFSIRRMLAGIDRQLSSLA